jgi:hypothetical protein
LRAGSRVAKQRCKAAYGLLNGIVGEGAAINKIVVHAFATGSWMCLLRCWDVSGVGGC